MAFRAGEKILVFSGKVVHRDQLLEPGALSARDWEMSLQVHQDLWQSGFRRQPPINIEADIHLQFLHGRRAATSVRRPTT